MKFWVNILFEWPQSLFAATKIYILIFNLTHSFISLMGSFHFPQWKIFLPIHWQIRNILGNEIPQLIMLSLKCGHALLYEFPSIDSIFGFWNVDLELCIFPSFSQFIKGIFEKPWLHFQIFIPNSLKSLKIEIFVLLSLYLVKGWAGYFSTMQGRRERRGEGVGTGISWIKTFFPHEIIKHKTFKCK